MKLIDEPGNEKIKKKYIEPEKASAVMGFHERIVYCKLEDIFWDKHTWTEYKERAINHTFQHEFKTKPSLIYGKNLINLLLKAHSLDLNYINLMNQYLKKTESYTSMITNLLE